MEKRLSKKLSVIDPRFRKQIQDLFEKMQDSISILYETAIRDAKTNLYNYKFFETQLEMEIEKAQRGKQKLSLMIIDIDFFKKVNDKLCHIKADELLIKLADIVKKQVRKSDIPARFGGEEFFILLPETDLKKASNLAKRLRNSVKSNNLLKKHKITISGGITQFKNKDTKKSFKERADKALYQAKNQGRDRFVSLR